MSDNAKMTEARFAELAALHGADIATWPEAERGAARLIAGQSGPRGRLAEAAALDTALAEIAAEPAPAPSPELTARILEAAGAARVRSTATPPLASDAGSRSLFRRALDRVGDAFAPAAACAASAAFGLWMGYAGAIDIAEAADPSGDTAFYDRLQTLEPAPFEDALDILEDGE